MPKWYDDGVRVNLSVSTAGDFVALGTRTEYPFQTGGTPAGIPLGWTVNYNYNGAAPGDVNFTTANGRFSVSNKSTTVSNASKYYNIWRDFPVTAGKRYIFYSQARTMDGKQGGVWNLLYSFNGTGGYGFENRTQQDWEQTALVIDPPAGTTFIRYWLMSNYYLWPGEVEAFDWGVQWQNVAVVEMDTAYPDPVWKDITCDVQACSISYGRSEFTGRFEVGSAQISVRNIDGEFTYQNVHPWGLRPGRFLKVTIVDPKNAGWPSFYGLIDSITEGFPIDGKTTAVLNCIDTSSLLSNTTVPTCTSYAAIIKSGARFGTLLTASGWHPQYIVKDDGQFWQQAIKANGRTVRDELGLGGDSEGGFVWMDRQGYMTFKDRTYLTTNDRASIVQAELLAECPTFIDETKWIFPQVTGNAMLLATESAYDFPTTVEVVARVRINNQQSANRQTLISQDNRWDFRINNGSPNYRMEFSNNVGYATSSAQSIIGSNIIHWVRMVYNRANGTVAFYVQVDQGTNNQPSSWSQVGTTQSITGTMPVNTTQLRVGDIASGFVQAFGGQIYRLILKDNLVIKLDMTPVPGTAGNTYFTLASGKPVNVIQTGTNVIVQKDNSVPPNDLPPVDTIPTTAVPAIVMLKALATDWSRSRVVNDIQIANAGGGAFQKIDHESQQKYGPRTYQRLDFVNHDNYPEFTQTRINDYLTGWTEAMLRVNQVTFVPQSDNYAWLLGMWLLDLVRVRYEHPTEGWGFAVATHIQGFVHNLTMGGWETTLNLDQPLSFTFWDLPPGGGIGWDEDYWDDGIWDNDDPGNAYWSSGQVWSDPDSKWSY